MSDQQKGSDSQADSPCVVFLGNDLMFQSRIGSVVRSSGFRFLAIRDVSKFPEGLGNETQVKWVLVDLGMAGLKLPELPGLVRTSAPGARLLGYGAHVQKDVLDLAVESGFDLVLTRGQFDRDMAEILSGSTT